MWIFWKVRLLLPGRHRLNFLLPLKPTTPSLFSGPIINSSRILSFCLLLLSEETSCWTTPSGRSHHTLYNIVSLNLDEAHPNMLYRPILSSRQTILFGWLSHLRTDQEGSIPSRFRGSIRWYVLLVQLPYLKIKLPTTHLTSHTWYKFQSPIPQLSGIN